MAIAAYTLAGFSVLGTLGVDTKPLVAGLGVGGFTVGFALRVSGNSYTCSSYGFTRLVRLELVGTCPIHKCSSDLSDRAMITFD